VDRFLLAFDRRFDRAVALVRDPAFESHASRHARREEAVADALDLAVDPDEAKLFWHAAQIVNEGVRRIDSLRSQRIARLKMRRLSGAGDRSENLSAERHADADHHGAAVEIRRQ